MPRRLERPLHTAQAGPAGGMSVPGKPGEMKPAGEEKRPPQAAEEEDDDEEEQTQTEKGHQTRSLFLATQQL